MIALVLSFTYICLLRCLAGPIVGIGIAACFLLILASELCVEYNIVTSKLHRAGQVSHKGLATLRECQDGSQCIVSTVYQEQS